MKKFKIKDVEKYIVSIYEVEAETEKEALDKYINVLAGGIESVNEYYNSDEDDGISILITNNN